MGGWKEDLSGEKPLVGEFLEDLFNSKRGQFIRGNPFRPLIEKSLRIEDILGQGALGLDKALAPEDLSAFHVHQVKSKGHRSRA